MIKKGENKARRLIIAIMAIFIMMSASTVFAQEQEEKIVMPKGSFVVEKEQVHENDELLKVFPGVYNKGHIKGSLVFYTTEFINRGVIDGDVIGIASTFNSTGAINSDVLGYFDSVYLNDTKLNGDLKVYGGTVITNEKAKINGDVLIYGNDVEIRGSIKGNITVVANKVLLDAKIGGDVKAGSNEFIIGNNASIDGNVKYQSDTPAVQAPESKIGGEISQQNLGYTISDGNNVNDYLNELTAGYAVLVAMSVFILALIIFKMFPLSSFKFDVYLKTNIFKNFITGAIVTMLLMPLTFFLIMTIVGIPVSLSVISIYFNLLYIARIPAALLIGRLFIRRDGALSMKLVIGLAVQQLLSYLPFGIVNTIIILLFNMAGLGAIIQIIFTKLNRYYKKEKMEYNTLMSVIMNNQANKMGSVDNENTSNQKEYETQSEIDKNLDKEFKEEATNLEDESQNEEQGEEDER